MKIQNFWSNPRTIRTFVHYVMSTAISAGVIATNIFEDGNNIHKSQKLQIRCAVRGGDLEEEIVIRHSKKQKKKKKKKHN